MTATLIQTPQVGVLLKNISWQTYESLVNELAEQAGIRLTYDRGTLEIMTPSAPHEGSKKNLGRFVESVTEELNEIEKLIQLY
jgi:Uma2 family endonuclease